MTVDVAKYTKFIGEVDPWRVFAAAWSAVRKRWPRPIGVRPVSPQWLDDHERQAARRGDRD
jgi:hypothetical protein